MLKGGIDTGACPGPGVREGLQEILEVVGLKLCVASMVLDRFPYT